MSTNMTVPNHMVQDVERFMAAMAVSPSPSPSASPSAATSTHRPDPEANICEVKSIITHYVDAHNNFSFHILFHDKSSEWIPDDRCDCEHLIATYLHNLGIITNYLVCRVSTKEQAHSTSVSLDAQEQELRLDISSSPRHRIKVIRLTQSAYSSIPKQLEHIGHAAQRGDTISIYRVDRLSRNIIKYLAWIEDINSRGVDIHAVSDSLLYSLNKLDFIQLIVEAQKEATMLGDRIRMANRRKLQRGDEAIGGLKFGKKYIHHTDESGHTIRKTVGIHPEEFSTIQTIMKLHNQSCSNTFIAQDLNQKRIFKRSKSWNPNMIAYIIKHNRMAA